MSSVFSHESARRNDAGHLIDKNVFDMHAMGHCDHFRIGTVVNDDSEPNWCEKYLQISWWHTSVGICQESSNVMSV